jgi:predicted nucleic acid-binding protein
MSGEELRAERGLLDTNILIHWPRLDPASLPALAAISAVSAAELAAAVHGDIDAAERAARMDLLQRVESSFEPLPFDAEAARAYGRVTAAVRATGRSPRARVADQMIAATAVARGLPLFTTNDADFLGLEALLEVVPVARPER